MSNPGQRLRILREQLGYTLRDVETASMRIAQKYKNDEFAIPLSRLSDVETKGVLPSIYRLYSLSVAYRLEFLDILKWYGIDLSLVPSDLPLAAPPRTHRLHPSESLTQATMPVKLDPSFDLRRTTNFGRMVEQWGVLPLSYLSTLANNEFTYGYVGSDDFTMYPLILPGTFLQVDESRDEVIESVWRSEYERPIYFVETREGHFCCWCAIKGDYIILQSHPLSPVPVRMLRHPQEAEVIGQVVGIAMRLDRLGLPARAQEPRAFPKLT